MISIIHPSRGRFLKCTETTSKFFTMADNTDHLYLHVSIDTSDPSMYDYEDYYSAEHICLNNNRSAIDAINNAAKECEGDILMVISDDTECFPGWDTALLKEVKGKTDWILKTQDGIQNYIITNPIMDRAYYNRLVSLQNGIYHPDFDHLFCDTFLTCQADIFLRKITSNLLFNHNHYSVNGTQPDELHKRNDATWKQGEETFIRLMKQFPREDIQKIKDRQMIRWLRNKGVQI